MHDFWRALLSGLEFGVLFVSLTFVLDKISNREKELGRYLILFVVMFVVKTVFDFFFFGRSVFDLIF